MFLSCNIAANIAELATSPGLCGPMWVSRDTLEALASPKGEGADRIRAHAVAGRGASPCCCHGHLGRGASFHVREQPELFLIRRRL